MAATLVLGQSGFTSNSCNGGGSPTAASLCFPGGLATAGERLAVADTQNSRVLGYAAPIQ